MIKQVLQTLLCGLPLICGTAFAHGEDEPGPHGGEIRMPGAFHVEAVQHDDALRVYLLNMQFEQPKVRNSSVTARLVREGQTTQLECAPLEDTKAFRCPPPAGTSLARGTLAIDATRAGKPANTAEYDLPLAWSEDQ